MKRYTFNVTCSFSMQYTFTEHEVEPDEDGDVGDFEPIYSAQRLLAEELKEHLGQNFALNDALIDSARAP